MRTNRTRWTTMGVAAAATVSLAACSSGGSAAEPDEPAEQAGPVSIEIWGWDAETGEQIVDAFNEAQDDVEAEYVLQASNVATQTNFQNAMEAGSGVPCLVQGFAPLTTMVVNGWAQDITEYVEGSTDLYNEGALAAAQVDGRYYGLPAGSDAQFYMVNQKTFDEYDVEVPTTWDEFVEVGRELKKDGVDITNLAGEDPTPLMHLAQQAGAEWFAIDGDQWVVNFTDERTLAAADVFQQLIDEDMVSNQTYMDRPALYKYFDSGKMASTTTQWWSLTGLQTNMPDSAGDWTAHPIPQFADAAAPVTPGRATASFVPVGCEHPEAVVAFHDWRTTPEAIEAGRNAETGAIGFPTQIPDPSDYVEEVVPEGFFADDQAAADEIVSAQTHVIGKFELGPNYDAWFPELQDQWGKAVAGEITLEEALTAVQEFVASDLENKGISYTVAE
ncbi:ABC transporter substrate-binding protein [Myceligenerans pegani]|uniref:Extracellular solute-binding protein n=1 Tax=Myceligenerans pegani TaxID=2776917 RepID=A0ABR9MVW2_9MICO|nr:extracellular solute-binding protein [Myceligenerans sp. TRM 65318]MBE1875520.1 extracellular solute-binding protein [Myceligenerans sp. TRM 65318]MBE3017791.1 extracellular solute-binding protein [Myceligenerans sp. TRM 65318]